MVNRIASSLALVAFAACLVAGGIQSGNPFSTVVLRALLAMGGTYVIGLAVGWAAQRMLEENLRSEEQRLRKSRNVRTSDR
jgi:NhaP-type Na+/H+ or K+/H+ antiporter